MDPPGSKKRRMRFGRGAKRGRKHARKRVFANPSVSATLRVARPAIESRLATGRGRIERHAFGTPSNRLPFYTAGGFNVPMENPARRSRGAPNQNEKR